MGRRIGGGQLLHTQRCHPLLGGGQTGQFGSGAFAGSEFGDHRLGHRRGDAHGRRVVERQQRPAGHRHVAQRHRHFGKSRRHRGARTMCRPVWVRAAPAWANCALTWAWVALNSDSARSSAAWLM